MVSGPSSSGRLVCCFCVVVSFIICCFRVCVRLRVVVSFVVRCFLVCVRLCVVVLFVVRHFCVCVRLRVVVSFVVLVFLFVFARLRSQMDELVRWLPKPILMLLEGGAA